MKVPDSVAGPKANTGAWTAAGCATAGGAGGCCGCAFATYLNRYVLVPILLLLLPALALLWRVLLPLLLPQHRWLAE